MSTLPTLDPARKQRGGHPATGHDVQFYENDAHLIEVVGRFLEEGLRSGAGAIAIATPEHRAGLERALRLRGVPVDTALARARLVFCDAAETLARVVKDESPDRSSLVDGVGKLLSEVAEALPGRPLRVFGEMVDLLWASGRTRCALELEALWNELAQEHRMELLCAYPLWRFPRAGDADGFRQICAAHDVSLPALPEETLRGDTATLSRTVAELQQQAAALRDEVEARRVAERALEQQKRELADFLENAAVGLHRVGPDGTILWANRAELDMLGYQPYEYVGRPVSDFHVDRDTCDAILSILLAGGELVDHPARLRCKDGSSRDVLINSNALFEDGAFLHSRCFTRDVTDLKVAQDRQAFLAALVQSSGDAIVSRSLDGTILFWNAGAESTFGYTAAEAVGRPISLIVPPELGDEEQSILERLQNGQKIEPFETVRLAKDGSRIDISLAVSPVRDSRGRIFAISKVARDITTHKRAAQALRESEERYRRLVGLLPVAMYTCEAPTGRITYYNDHAARLWGRSPDVDDTEARFCGSFRLFLPDGSYLPHDQCPMAVALREGRSFRNEEVILRRPDGSQSHVLVDIDPVHGAHGEVVGAINVFHDVSALKLAEQALREEKQNLQTLLDTLPVAVFFAHEPECRRISGNRAAEAFLQMPVGANLSKSAPRDEHPTHFRALKRGVVIPADVLPMQRAARGEIVRSEEIEHVFEDGTVRHALVSAQPLIDAADRPRGVVATMLDITPLRQVENRLREADHRKDEFLATLSHELRNPLAPLRSALSVLPQLLDEPVLFEKTRAMMQRQLEQLIRLVDDLLDVNRISRGKLRLRKERVDVASVIHQALETVRPLAESQQQAIEICLPEAAIALDADPARLAQVFGNLLDNACKYTPAKGEIRVSAALQGADVVVSVKDSGRGLPDEEREVIFDMFAQLDRTENAAGGLGIGLPLARRIVELHGGTVVARSLGRGHGSEFIVRLPAAKRADSAAPEGRTALSLSSSGCRILVVDDNMDAAESLATLLRLAGHELKTAYDGSEAIVQAQAFQPAVILLDIGLPRVDGYEVCRWIREQPWGADVVIVAVTGWGQERDRHRTRAAGFDAHLVKPVDPQALSQWIETRTRGGPAA